VAAGFLMKTQGLDWHTALFILGGAVTVISFLTFAVSFSPEAEREVSAAIFGARSSESVELAGVSS
jgi:NNP family nitrate/nitrite transporter-like MFS transporter